MKRRKIWLSIAMLATVLMPQLLRAQNVGININAVQPSILQGEQGYLDVKLCNTDPNGSPSPANTLRVLVSVPINLNVVGLTSPQGTPIDSDVNIMFMTNDDSEGSHNIKFQYKNVLNNFDCITFRVVLTGKTVGAGGTILGNLSFASPPVSNLTGDDNSSTSISVEVNLPVTLKEFNAEKQENMALLNWSTTEETNSDRFEVQRSSNGREWITIQTVQAAGESNLTRKYEAIDSKPMNGENLYRLKMIDKDSSTAFSSIRSLSFEGVGTVVYPNPVTDFLYVKTPDLQNVRQVTLIDVNGRTVYKSGLNPELAVDVRSLPSGIYNVKIKNTDGSETSYRVAVVK